MIRSPSRIGARLFGAGISLASFFVAENSNGTGNLGGLAGADQMCQSQAQALGGPAAAKTWHAYVSQEQRGNTPKVNARGRIGISFDVQLNLRGDHDGDGADLNLDARQVDRMHEPRRVRVIAGTQPGQASSRFV